MALDAKNPGLWPGFSSSISIVVSRPELVRKGYLVWNLLVGWFGGLTCDFAGVLKKVFLWRLSRRLGWQHARDFIGGRDGSGGTIPFGNQYMPRKGKDLRHG
jgi:hypothetical protein